MNYIQHNKELDGTLYKPESPVIFIKPDSALLKDGKPFSYPTGWDKLTTKQSWWSGYAASVKEYPSGLPIVTTMQ